MANEALVTVTDADVRALAAKLKGLHALLTPAEQALVHAVLRRAAGRGPEAPDVEGIAWAVSFNPFPYLDSIASKEFGAWPPTAGRSKHQPAAEAPSSAATDQTDHRRGDSE
ncbi:MAG: hypothetical protein ACRDJN_04430 [Chloroflexota bacterium]